LPSSSESSAAIDFITAFGRLLRDGALRDAFAADPDAVVQQIGLQERDRPVFMQLRPADLEFQARILLRKRFEVLRPTLPRTYRNLGGNAWVEFQRYARTGGAAGKDEAIAFCQHLRQVRPEALCLVEVNRCAFVHGPRRVAVHFVLAPIGGDRRRPGVQVFLRRRPDRWHEWLVYFSE
jgi:hypothetical protein